MSMDNVQFPPAVSYGSSGGPGFNTALIVMDSGQEQRVGRWSQARRKWNVAEGVKKQSDLSALIAFYVARQGPLYSFRFKDWSDYHTGGDGSYTTAGGDASTDAPLGTGDGATTQFQCYKAYASGPVTRNRVITLPIAATVKVAIDGVNQTTGWSVNDTTGLVTFTAAPTTGAVLTWGGEFDVPARFGDAMDDHLPVSIDNFDTGSVQITVQEVLAEGYASDEFFYGGAVELADAPNFSMSVTQARLYVVTTAGCVATLPDATSLPTGGPYFVVMVDASGTGNVQVKDFGGVNVGPSVAPGNAVEVWLSADGSGTKYWYAF